MSQPSSSNSTSKDIDVSVHINPERQIECRLNPKLTLSDIRKCLEGKPEIKMGTNMWFLTKNGIILNENEKDRFLKDILVTEKEKHLFHKTKKTHILNIQYVPEKPRTPEKPDWQRLVTNLNLEYGLDFKQDGPSYAPKKAFRIKKYKSLPLNDKPIQYKRSTKSYSKLDEILVKNRLIKANINVNYLQVSNFIFDYFRTEVNK